MSRLTTVRAMLFDHFAGSIRKHVFYCPICLDAFRRNELDQLRLARILPKELGGTRRALLCRHCARRREEILARTLYRSAFLLLFSCYGYPAVRAYEDLRQRLEDERPDQSFGDIFYLPERQTRLLQMGRHEQMAARLLPQFEAMACVFRLQVGGAERTAVVLLPAPEEPMERLVLTG
jgi:hypothetical protein